MFRIFLTNIPCDCAEAELQRWIETRGFSVDSVRVVRDLVSFASPAFGYVSLIGPGEQDAVLMLDGQNLRGRKLQVREDWRNERRCG